MGLRSYLQGTTLLRNAVRRVRVMHTRREHPFGIIPERPQRIIVEPTNACNLKCTFCGNKDMLRPHTWLSLDLYEQLLEEMGAMGVPRLTLHTVGEPTLHEELPRMIRMAKERGLTVTFSTNGTTLTPEKITELVLAGPDIMNLSIDAVDPDKLRRLRPGIDPEKLFKSVELLRKTRDEIGPHCESPWGQTQLPSLVATCVFTKEWSREEERAYFKRLGPLVDDFFFHWPNNHAGYVPDEPHRRKGILSQRLRDRIYGSVRMPCPYPWDALYLLSNGAMSVCRFDFDARVTVGRFGPESLAELWNSQRMMSLRKAHMDFDFREWPTCQDCVGTYYANRHEDYRRTQRLKRRNGYRSRRDMWLSVEPMRKQRLTGSGSQHT